jgi:hypothetical protein
LLLAGCDDSALRPRDHGRDATAPAASAGPPAPRVAEGNVARVQVRSEVPLAGTRVEARPGDWMLRSQGLVAVVSTQKGRLVDFGREGGDDGVFYIEALGYDAVERMHTEVVSVAPAGEGGRALHVVKRVLDKPLTMHVFYAFEGAHLRIESLLSADGPSGVLAVTLGEVFSWGNTPSWLEGHGSITFGGTFSGEFIGRESQGLAYAACSAAGRLVGRFSSPDLPGFHVSARTGEEVVTIAAGQSSARRTIVLALSNHSVGDAAMTLPCVGGGRRQTWPLPEGAPATASIEVARCPRIPPPPPPVRPPPPVSTDATQPPAAPPAPPKVIAGTPFARFADVASRRDLTLPEGCFVARLVAPGHAPGRWATPAEIAAGWAADATLLPASGTLRWAVTEAGAPTAAKVVVKGVPPTPDPSWGDDPDAGAAMNAVYSIEGAGERPLPPGTFKVFVHRGPEHSMHEQEVRVTAGSTTLVRATLERVVDTRGWISADLHLHAAPSFDAPTSLEDRVRSLTAVDVEVAVATDHNVVTDYGPTIRAMGQQQRLASIVGNEVTTRDVFFGHYNAFPLPAGSLPVHTESVLPKQLFAAMRASGKPGAPMIIQVNHPRMGDIGYLELLRFDPVDVAAWKARASLADMDFDALEVFNGDHYADIGKVERCMTDWYALLDAGQRVVATGNSDSHKITFQEAGVPRNWVHVEDDDPARFDEARFIEAVRAGRVIVSSGPFVDLRVGEASLGQQVEAGEHEVTVRVEAPPWIDVSRIELVRRGVVLRTWTGPIGPAPRRFEMKTKEQLASGDWLVAVVRGDKPMKPLYRDGAKPFAFTNPIFVR